MALMTETSETSVYFNKTAWHYTPDDISKDRHWNMASKSQNVFQCAPNQTGNPAQIIQCWWDFAWIWNFWGWRVCSILVPSIWLFSYSHYTDDVTAIQYIGHEHNINTYQNSTMGLGWNCNEGHPDQKCAVKNFVNW